MDFFKNKFKRSGFTLMEIAISVFIVAILAAITIPLIKKQLEKADEYSYYLAYKTVEKMAGQIVAMGDPEEINDITSMADPEVKFADKMKNTIKTFIADNGSKVKIFFTNAGHKFAKSEEYMFRKMFPSAFAEYLNNIVFQMSSEEYDGLWLALKVCSMPNNLNTYMKTKEQTGTDPTTGNPTYTVKYYTWEDFQNCLGYGKTGSYGSESEGNYVEVNNAWQNVVAALPEVCPNLNITTITNTIISQASPNAANFQTAFNASCSGSKTIDGTAYTYTTKYTRNDSDDDDEDDDEDDGDNDIGDINAVDTPETPEADQGMLSQWAGYNLQTTDQGSSTNPTEKPVFAYNYCDAKMGTFNMVNKMATPSTPGVGVDCGCNETGTYSQLTANNDRACCKPCSEDNAVPYYNSKAVNTSAKCVCCSTDFNPETGTCCPKNSVYVSGNTCTCISGYGPAGVCNVLESCPPGTTKDPVEKVCVVNPPVIKASRFCSMIKDYYNINSSNCNSGFTPVSIKGGTINYNQPVYEAAVSNSNNRYLSIASNTGAFQNITPNIVFSNGLPMWILADKAASIPGLTYTTDDIDKNQNICINLRKHSQSACKNADDKAYYCKAENTCFTMDDDSLTTMGDARNCCAAADLSTLAAVTQTDPNYNSDDYKKDKRTYAIGGFTVFVDINGQNKGSGTLWEDVFPFYIAANGSVYPAYPLDAPKSKDHASNSLYLGGNSEKQLAVDVYYYESTTSGTSRKKVVAFPNVSYARGVCSARLVSKYAPYCLNIGEKYVNGASYISDDDITTSTNPCDKNKCYVSVRQKLRSF